jgi:hypothetical protein
LDERGKIAFIAGHMFFGVVRPKRRRFIVDHHHLPRAVLEKQVQLVLFNVLANLSELDKREFWMVIEYQNWGAPTMAKVASTRIGSPQERLRLISARRRRPRFGNARAQLVGCKAQGSVTFAVAPASQEEPRRLLIPQS